MYNKLEERDSYLCIDNRKLNSMIVVTVNSFRILIDSFLLPKNHKDIQEKINFLNVI